MLLNISPIAALNSSVYLVIVYWIHIFFLCGSHLSLFVSKYHFCFFLFWDTLIIAGLTVQPTSSQQSEALEISPPFLQLTAQLWFSPSCSEFLCDRNLRDFESAGGLLRCGFHPSRLPLKFLPFCHCGSFPVFSHQYDRGCQREI